MCTSRPAAIQHWFYFNAVSVSAAVCDSNVSDCAIIHHRTPPLCFALSHTTLKRESQLRWPVLPHYSVILLHPNTPLTPSLHRTEVSKFLGNLILLLIAKFSFEMQPEKMRHLDEGRIVQSPHTHDAR